MARAFSRVAGKDYPEHGIKKGDTYYYWSIGFRGAKQMSKTRPRQSQLTGSKMSGAYAASEAAGDAIDAATSIEDITSALSDCVDAIREVASEYEEAAQATTGNGNRVPNADEMEEKAQGLNDWADSIEQDATEVEGIEVADHVDENTTIEDLDEDQIEVEQDTEGNETKKRKDVEDFDDLTDAEKDDMLEAARDAARANLDCPL